MANSRDCAVDFIQDTFRPLVGVLCSEEAERHCQKNNLSFVKLIEPFCVIPEGSIKDINNTGHTVKNFKIVCHDLNELSVSKLISKKKLNDIISRSYTLDSQIKNHQKRPSHLGIPLDHGSNLQSSHGNSLPTNKLEHSLKAPWYESYRKSFLDSLPYSDHEYLRHYVACIIAVSTSEPYPLDQLNSLFHSPTPSHHPSMAHTNSSASTLLQEAKWFVPTFLRFIVLLHDASEQDDMKADAVYQSVKEKFGNQSCHLLHINSKPLLPFHGSPTNQRDEEKSLMNNPWKKYADNQNSFGDLKDSSFPHDAVSINHDHLTSDHHPLMSLADTTIHHYQVEETKKKVTKVPGSCLTPSDVDRIIIFISQFITHALFNWAEKTLKTLNEQTSTRKGIKGSLFSASRWFGRTKPVGQGQNTSSVVYSSDSPEMQLRRLADLSFLFQLYDLSYQTYHGIKKDFLSDSAWMHHAGALEMACLSVFLQDGTGAGRQYPYHYMEQAIKSYHLGAHSVNFAARATILSTEILRSKGMFAEAATQFMTVTSEDSDLLSALFLEQTAHCFLEMKVAMVRKYAFHMVLAGHRFNKAGQKKHVLRCYAQALEVFKDKMWSLAEDHIYLTIGSQAYNIRELALATSAYLHLLSPHSKQSANQQAAFFAQYLNIYKISSSSPASDERTHKKQLEILPLPLVDSKSIKVTCCLTSKPSQEARVPASGVSLDGSDTEREVSFAQLEENLVASTNRKNVFKPSIFCHTQYTDNSSNVLAVLGEPTNIEMCLENPLKIPLTLLNVHLLWRFSPLLGSSAPIGDDNDAGCISNEPSFQEKVTTDQLSCVQFLAIPEFHMEGLETKMLKVSLTCMRPGRLHVTGLAFNLMTGLKSNIETTSTTESSSVSGSSSFVSIGGTNIADQQDPQGMAAGGALSNGFAPQYVSNIPAVPPNLPATFYVPGMIALQVSGKRLNSTKEERLNVKYAVDKRLHFDVLPVKIRLELYLCNLPTSMLCGEVVQSRLEFSNCGQQKVSKLFLASNQMEMFSFRDEDVTKVTNKEGILKISLPKGGLAPGETISKELKVTCPDLSGKHPVDILILYSGDDDDDEYDEETKKMCSKMRYRLIRHTTCIKAEASVIMASQNFPSLLSFSPSSPDDAIKDGGTNMADESSAGKHSMSSPRNNINVTLKVDNINPDYDFSVAKIFCVSEYWKLKLNDDLNIKKNLSIRPGEYHLLSLGAYKTIHDDVNEVDRVSCLSFSDEKEPHEIFDRRECTNDKPSPAAPLTRHHSGFTVDHGVKGRVDGNIDETKFILVIIWKAQCLIDLDQQVRHGRHVLSFNWTEELVESMPVLKIPFSMPQVKFTISGDTDSLPVSVIDGDVQSRLVKMSLHFEANITHDFASQKSCIVDVKVTLLNCSDLDLFVSLETSDVLSRSKEPITTDLRHHSTNQKRSFTWVGRTKVSLKLSSNENACHNMKARIFQAGVYDLSCIKTFVSIYDVDRATQDDNENNFDISLTEGTTTIDRMPLDRLLQKPSNPSLLTVMDSEEV